MFAFINLIRFCLIIYANSKNKHSYICINFNILCGGALGIRISTTPIPPVGAQNPTKGAN